MSAPPRTPPATTDGDPDYRPDEPVAGAKLYSAWAACRALTLAALVLACLNSQALLDYVTDLPVGPWSDRAVAAAEVWHGWMAAIGLDRPSIWLRAAADAALGR